jgi:hypothetical protein
VRKRICQTCKHWTPPKEFEPQFDQSDEEYPNGRGVCERITMIGDSARPVPKTALAHVEDGSYYKAELHTKPEFGCVLHES